MRSAHKQTAILVSLVVVVPLAVTLGVKTVSGSEPPGRLVVNGDGTVTDNVTKLLWQQATNPSNVNGSAASVCGGTDLGGHSTGWRLPTIKELVSIVDFESATSPKIDTTAFPLTQTTYYWTSTVMPQGQTGQGEFFIVNFNDGSVLNGHNTTANTVYRCVHAAP